MVSIAAKRSRQVGRSLPSVGRQVAAAQPTRSPKISPLLTVFVFSLAMPILIYIGPIRLSPYRLVLVASFIPCLIAWLSGRMGRTRLPDILMLLTAIWPAIILVSQHGIDSGLQSAGIFVIETLGTFLLAKRYVRDVFAFHRMVRCLALMVVLLLPFAAYESISGSPILIELFGKVFSVYSIVHDESRMGLRRAQGPFEHQILFGVVCSSAFALSYYAFGAARRQMGRLALGPVVMAVFFSLSSGALLSVVVQGHVYRLGQSYGERDATLGNIGPSHDQCLSCRERPLQPNPF
ncbi:hypothetical protein ACVWZL_002408 [Bradyrhizobium sp. GM2.4]